MIRIVPRFIIPNSFSPIIFLDRGVSGTALATTSARGKRRWNASGLCSSSTKSGFSYTFGSVASTRIPKPKALRDLAADAAQGDDQQRLALKLLKDEVRRVSPCALRGLPDEVRQAASEREQVGDGLVGNLGCEDALHVRQHDVALEQLWNGDHPFHPRAALLHPPQFFPRPDMGRVDEAERGVHITDLFQ